MREWRFDDNGVAKDALTFEDTFGLCSDANDVAIGIYYNEPADSPVRLAALENLSNALFDKYDYVCIFCKSVFPVLDSDTRKKDRLLLAMKRAKDNGLLYPYF